ncbi:hypothetical protein D9M68_712950 [compost metagenome]
MVVAAIDHIVVGGGDAGGIGPAAAAGALALVGGAQVVAELEVPVSLLLDVFDAQILDVFEADDVAQRLEEGAAEVRLQAKGDLVQADLELARLVELVADPGVFGEGDIADLVGVVVGVGIAVEAVLGRTYPAVGVVAGGEEGGVEAEFLEIAVGVVVDARAHRAADVEVVVDRDRANRQGDGCQQGQGAEGGQGATVEQGHGATPLRYLSCFSAAQRQAAAGCRGLR